MSSLTLYWVLLACVVLERGAEIAMARRNARWSFARGGVESGRRHYALVVLLHVGLILGCALEPVLWARPFIPWLGWPALIATGGCQTVRWWCVAALGPRWNTRIIVVPGLPLVRTGPYRWLDHPNYAAVLVEGLALPLVHTAWVTAACMTIADAVLLRHRVRVEDRALGRRPQSPTAAARNAGT